MKKIILFIISALILPIGCDGAEFDEILRQDENKSINLEAFVRTANNEIATIKGLIDALEEKTGIISYTELLDQNGYELLMSDGTNITLKNGVSSIINVNTDSEELLNWTLDSKWLLDGAGKMILAQGAEGKTPELRASTSGDWEVTLDEGSTWQVIKDDKGHPIPVVSESDKQNNDNTTGDTELKNNDGQGNAVIVYRGVTYTIPQGNAIATTEHLIDITTRGAVFNDETFDNRPILEQAMQDLNAIGGGVIFIPDKGDLYVSANVKFEDNITMIGAPSRPTIKIMPDQVNFWSILHMDRKSNIQLKNITIDSNRDVREARGTLGDLVVNSQIGISIAEGSENILIENCTLKTNGVWMISVFCGTKHPKNIVIQNNHLIWTMGYAEPDKPFAEGVTIDNTLIYFDAVDYQFINNYVETNTGSANMTGIEVHGANATVKNNYFRGVRTGCIPWSFVTDEITGVDNNLNISENVFEDVLNGFDIGMSPGRNLINVQIHGNKIRLNPAGFPGARFSRGIICGTWNAVNGEVARNVSIKDNIISSKPFNMIGNDRDIYYNFYGIGVISGICENLEIKDNVLENLGSFGILAQNEYQKTLQIRSGVIEGNIIKDVAQTQNLRDGMNITAIYISPRPDVKAQGLVIGENYIFDSKEIGNYYDQATSIPSYITSKPQIIVNTSPAVSSTIVYDSSVNTPVFQTSDNIYLRTFTIQLTPSTVYYVDTTLPANNGNAAIFVTDDQANKTKVRLTPNNVQQITTDPNGYIYVYARPPVDVDGTAYNYNYTQIESGMYKLLVREKTTEP